MTGTPAHEKLRAALLNQEKQTMAKVKRNTLTENQTAWLEMLIRAGQSDEELAKWRQANDLHHHTVAAAIKRIRERLERDRHQAKLASRIEAMNAATKDPAPAAEETAAIEPELPMVLPVRPGEQVRLATTPATRPTPLDPLIEWLSAMRAMRDDLAGHGVTVEGTLNITINL